MQDTQTHTHTQTHDAKTITPDESLTRGVKISLVLCPLFSRCGECPFETDARHRLKSHIILKHEWPKVCEICGIQLASPVTYKSHMQSKHEDGSYSCQECGKVTIPYSLL